MIELAAFILADTAAVLNAAYWGGLIIGGGLLLVSIIGGADSDVDVDTDGGFDFDTDADFDVDFDADIDVDADFDLDVDADVAHAAHAGAAGLASWFSMRFVVFFMAVFGAVGVILTYMTETGMTMAFVAALIAGLVVGQAVHQMFRAIKRTSGDSATRPRDYVNKLARVTIAITHPDKGEVAVHVRGTRRCVPAVVIGVNTKFDIGDEVVVVEYRAGVARVVSRAEFEQRARSR